LFYPFSETLLKKSILISIIFISLIGSGIGGYFLINELVMNSLEKRVKLTAVKIPEEIMKGDSLPVTLELLIGDNKEIVITSFSLGIESGTYSLNGTVNYNLLESIEGEGSHTVVLFVGPLLDTSTGYFALNGGEFRINSLNLVFEGRIPQINKILDNSFTVISGLEEEQLVNRNFQDGLDSWEMKQSDENVSVSVVQSSPLEEESLKITNLEEINSSVSSWIAISQTLNLTQTHFISFQQSIISTNCSFEVYLYTDGIKVNMSLILDETSATDQLIHYGYADGFSNITLQIVFAYADNATEFYLDNLSILQYVHRVFVVVLNDNWEIIGNEIGRDSPSRAIEGASFYFVRELGYELIPIIEHEWHPPNVSMEVVDDLGLEAAGEKLSLNRSWHVAKGRSDLNHGFDLLTGFSNRTSEHFGFAYYTYNVAFHFAQSKELGEEYSWVTIVNDFADNLVQHEISHNFGAHDRDRTYWPPSVMSKPSTPEQVYEDVLGNKLWLIVNNWLIEDIVLMLEHRKMFD
jgi:hypothetical protein